MARVIGLLPMGGRQTRLRFPVPKPLMPIITDTGIAPLYRFTYDYLLDITDIVWAIVNSSTDSKLLQEILKDGIFPLYNEKHGELSSALAFAAAYIGERYGHDALIATALPDSIWQLDDGMSMNNVLDKVRGDGAMALFRAGGDELDEVMVDGDQVTGIVTKTPEHTKLVHGWGAFIVRASAMATFTDAEKDGPQLGRLDMGWEVLGSYVDLGTSERYIQWHDQRTYHGG